MNAQVNQTTAADVVAVSRQPQAVKEQASDGKFQSMLSDAINGSSKPTEKTEPPKSANETASAKTGQKESTPDKPERQKDTVNEEDIEESGYTAATAAMQMQTILPVIAEIQDTEVPAEISVTALETTGSQPAQELQAETAQPAANAVTEDKIPAQPEKETPDTEIRADSSMTDERRTAAEPQAGSSVPVEKPDRRRTEEQAGAAGRTVRGTAAQEQVLRNAETRAEPQTGRRNAGERVQDEITSTQAIGRNGQITHASFRQVTAAETENPEQTRFSEMLTRASRELNRSAREMVTQDSRPDGETRIIPGKPTTETPQAPEVNPQGTAAQAGETKTGMEPQEEKPKANATVQKDEKAPVTQQRQQKEISKPDETVLGMVQQKQPAETDEAPVIETQVRQPGQMSAAAQAEQIKTQVIKNMEIQRTEFQMQLQPEELGKIDVKMILENGKLSVEILAANPKSAEMLAKQTESLMLSLKASSLDVSTVNVVAAGENTSAEMNGEYNLLNFQNRENSQRHSGRQNGTGTSRKAAEPVAGNEHERLGTPQRILNYSV